MAAVRYAIVAERLAPLLAEAEAVLATPLPDAPEFKLAAAKRKSAAQQALGPLRLALSLDEVTGA